jgi:uncharacterized membrane protein YfcA
MALAAAAALVAAAVQSATGFGFALILSPALLGALDRYEAVTALLALGLVLNLLVLFDGGRPGPVAWRELLPVLAAAVPGLALGAAALALFSKPVLQVVVGLVVLIAAAAQLRGRMSGKPARARSAAAAGLASGALTTSISVSGPPLVLWLESRGVPPAELRATLAACFLALNLAGCLVLVPLAGADRVVPADVLLPLLGLVVVGHLVGARAFRRLDPERFSVIVLVLVVLTGAASVVAGVLAL